MTRLKSHLLQAADWLLDRLLGQQAVPVGGILDTPRIAAGAPAETVNGGSGHGRRDVRAGERCA